AAGPQQPGRGAAHRRLVLRQLPRLALPGRPMQQPGGARRALAPRRPRGAAPRAGPGGGRRRARGPDRRRRAARRRARARADPAGRVDAYRQAVADLARALTGMPAHRGHDWAGIAGRLATAAADPGRPMSALTVHMRALADLLDAVDPASDEATERGPATVED